MKQKIYAALAILMIVTMLPGAALAAPSANKPLPGSIPSWANSRNFSRAADPNEYIGFRVYLGWQNADAAVALARAVSDPSSSHPHNRK